MAGEVGLEYLGTPRNNRWPTSLPHESADTARRLKQTMFNTCALPSMTDWVRASEVSPSQSDHSLCTSAADLLDTCLPETDTCVKGSKLSSVIADDCASAGQQPHRKHKIAASFDMQLASFPP
ncbi:hypothetical protein DOTSEDRAFT_34487 [Dothistroma septosporum NZE10]|uniref:Uncharacterized protein n=1 Tax=Dothistroma septosporum (strain NZE10 / CBS 128990) TaxID=675120 RepID=N1PND7_DOTSN|nr:hypothetical protein DOTSEDRAFT_34487 [Dothistroma septosporum NZE10]